MTKPVSSGSTTFVLKGILKVILKVLLKGVYPCPLFSAWLRVQWSADIGKLLHVLRTLRSSARAFARGLVRGSVRVRLKYAPIFRVRLEICTDI